MNKDRVLVWGAGAIGGTIGAFLLRGGHDVTFVDRAADHVAAIRDPSRGLSIEGPLGEFKVVSDAFTPEELVGTWDHIYLCVKGQDTTTAVKDIERHLGDSGYVVSLQNGLCEPLISEIIGERRTIGAFINFGADWLGPGRILFANHGAFVLGELDGSIPDRLLALKKTITSFYAKTIVTDDIQSYLWGKLGYATFLFAQALGQKGIADCLARPELLGLWRDLAGEVNAVARAQNISPRGFNGYDPGVFRLDADVSEIESSVAAMVAFNRPNLKTHSGIWRDIAVRKRRTEVDVQIAPIVALGEALGVRCPTIRRLVEFIHLAESGGLPLTDDNLLSLAGATV